MKLQRKDLNYIFDTDIEKLISQDESEIKFINQSHFGDLLIEVSETSPNEKYKLWRNLDENGGEIEIEYFGKLNGYIWETVLLIDTL